MNTALQSGYDLGWKLAWVLQGWADPDAARHATRSERRVVAEHNVTRSIDPNGSRRPVVDELYVDLGGRVAARVVAVGVGSGLHARSPRARMDAVHGTDAGRLDAVAPPSTARPDRPRARAVTARTLGVRGDGALLARPDGVPVAVWTSSAVRPSCPGR